MLDLQGELGLRAEPLDAGPAEVRPRDRRRLPDGRGDGHRRRRSSRTRSSRSSTSSATGMKSKPTNVEGLLFKEQEAGYLAGYMAGLYAKDKGGGHRRLRRRREDPAGRPLHRRLPGRRQGGQPGRSRRSTAYSQDFVDPAKCKELGAQPDRQGLRRSSSRSPASAASARSTPPRRRACRASASTPTRATWASTS